MKLFLSLFVLALGAASRSDGQELKLQRGHCPMFWYSFNGRCYKYIATHLSWADAELYCRSQNTNLVSIHSLEEQEFVNSLIKNFDPAQAWTWIGLSDLHKEGGWMWSDGSKFNFHHWNVGQPDNGNKLEHCGHTNHGTNHRWNDWKCSETCSFVCETINNCP